MKPKRLLLRILLGIVLLWVVASCTLAVVVDQYGRTERVQPADVIVLLGPPVQRRINTAVRLWQDGYAPYILCSGEEEPPFTPWMAERCRLLLLESGIPEEAILIEGASMSTEENALYSRTLIQARGWNRVILVSDNFHLLRASWLFGRLGLDVTSSPAAPAIAEPLPYVVAVLREVIALQWQALKDLLNLPYTRVTGV